MENHIKILLREGINKLVTSDNLKLDPLVMAYTSGKMNFFTFDTKINEEVKNLFIINEGVEDIIKKMVDWVLSKLATLAASVIGMGWDAYGKFISVSSTIVKSISKFKDNHPILFKVFKIVAVILIILLIIGITSTEAHAGIKFVHPDILKQTTVINEAIKFIDDTVSGWPDYQEAHLGEVREYLVEMRRAIESGEPQNTKMHPTEVIKFGDASIDYIKWITKGDLGDNSAVTKLSEEGQKIINAATDNFGRASDYNSKLRLQLGSGKLIRPDMR